MVVVRGAVGGLPKSLRGTLQQGRRSALRFGVVQEQDAEGIVDEEVLSLLAGVFEQRLDEGPVSFDVEAVIAATANAHLIEPLEAPDVCGLALGVDGKERDVHIPPTAMGAMALTVATVAL